MLSPDQSIPGDIFKARGAPFTTGKWTPSYPNKIFSLAETYMPKKLSELFDLCAYFFTTSSLVHPVIYKLSEYPVTRFRYTGGEKRDQERLKGLVENQWAGRQHLIETGLYYHTFGNCFTVLSYMCKRYLKCPRCNSRYQITKLPFKWIEFQPHAKCPSSGCRYDGRFEFFKAYPRHPAYIRPVILDPRQIQIRYNPITGRRTFLYRIPKDLRMALAKGDPYILEDTPDVFIDAVRMSRMVRLDHRNLYHFVRPGLSASNDGFGMPLVAPVMQDIYYSKTLRRAQEAISLQHIVPMVILFPQATAGVNPPVTNNMQGDIKKIEGELAKWRKDPNYIPIMPQPVGVEHVGGQARALMITPELEMINNVIINGMLAPQELVQGGLSWSGSSISLRIIENHFLNYRHDIEEFLSFAVAKSCAYLRWAGGVKVRLHPFKMADDVQRLQLLMAASQAGAVSNARYLDEMDIDIEEDHKRRMEEMSNLQQYSVAQQTNDARAQGEAQLILSEYEMRAQMVQQRVQQEEMEQQAQRETGVPLPDPQGLAYLIAQMLIASPERIQQEAIMMLQNMPTLGQMVQEAINQIQGGGGAAEEEGSVGPSEGDQQGADSAEGQQNAQETQAMGPGSQAPGQVPSPPGGVQPGGDTRRPPRRQGGI